MATQVPEPLVFIGLACLGLFILGPWFVGMLTIIDTVLKGLEGRKQ